MDPIDVCLDLMRRLSPENIESNLNKLITLSPDLAEDLFSAVDQPLKIQRCPESGREYLLCDYNRVDQSYRYYEGGVSSVYMWDLKDGFACVVLIKKALSDDVKVSGCWDSIHVIEVQESYRSAHYKLTTTIMLSLGQNQSALGYTSLAGSLTRQAEQDSPLEDYNGHVENIGRIVEDMETKMRNALNEIYFGKTKDIVNDLRSVHSIAEGKKQANIQAELFGKLMDRGSR
ncbi:hypothetical protein HDU97_003882 [Phlyctochytrium planicorne]|nr:hypothetical protein HDU97_003882 [Phlyctochytrium planicorne]